MKWKYVAEMETRFAHDLPLVPCHAGEFNQVILNLIVNAAHAIREIVGDGRQGLGKITITTRRDRGCVEVAIRDTGCGIPEQIQPRISEPFFTTKPVGQGTGQGLALAHATIVRRHGGRLWSESTPGQGTTIFCPLTDLSPSRIVNRRASLDMLVRGGRMRPPYTCVLASTVFRWRANHR